MQRSRFRGFPLWYENPAATASMIRQIEQFPPLTIPDQGQPLVIDCGANIGISVLEWKTRWPHCRILCFEPDPRAYALLLRNVGELPAVEPIQAAVADFEGSATLYGDSAPGGDARGNSIDAAWGERGDGETVEVRCQRLSRYLQNGPVSFLKLDIEGMEARVLAEAGAGLSAVQTVYVEVHQTRENAAYNSRDRVQRMLAEAGFEVQVQDRPDAHALPAHLDAWRRRVGARMSQLIGRR